MHSYTPPVGPQRHALTPCRASAGKLAQRSALVVRLLPAALVFLGLGSTQAATGTWKGTAENALWSNPNNWSASPVPGSGDTAKFQSNSVYTTIDLEAGVSVKTITFGTTNCAAYTIGSGDVNAQTLTLEDGGLVQGAFTLMNSQLFNAKIVIGSTASASTIQFNPISSNNIPAAKRTMTLAGDITASAAGGAKTLNLAPSSTGPALLVVSGVISDGGAAPVSVLKNNGGTATLSGANTYTGNTTMNGNGAGTLALNHVNALQFSTLDTGVSGAQKVTFVVAGNNTYNLGGLQGTDDLAIGANTINVGANGQTTTYAGVISGTGALIKSGTGTLTLSGASSYTGSTTISNGSLVLSASGSIASVLVTNYGTFDVSALGGYHLTNGMLLTGNGRIVGPLTVDPGATLAVGSGTADFGTLTVDGGLTMNGTTTLRLNKGGTSDQIVASSGTLTLGGTIILNSVGQALANGDAFQVLSAGSSGTPVILGNPGAGLQWDASRLNSEGIIQVVASANPPAFSVTLTDQTVECGSNATFYALATGTAPLVYTWKINGAAVASGIDLTTFTTNNVHNGGSSYTVVVQVTNLVNSAVSTCTLRVQDTLKPALTLMGPNEMWLLQGQLFTDPGATAADTCAGVITPTVSGVVNVSVPGDYILTYTANDGNGNVETASRTVHVQAIRSGVWTSTADGAWMTANNWSNGTVALGPNSTADFSQVSLSASTTVHLDQPVSIGNLIFDDLSGTGQSWTLDNNGNAANVLTLASSNRFAMITANNSNTISAALTGTNGLLKSGPGTLSLSASNSYSCGTVISNGTLRLGSTNVSLLGSGPVAIAAGGRLLADRSGLKTVGNDITLAGVGTDGNGAIFLAGQPLSVSNVTLSADATIGSDSQSAGFNVYGTVDIGTNTLTFAPGFVGDASHTYLFWNLNGNVSGTGVLNVSAGALVTNLFRLYLNTANTFSGETTVSSPSAVSGAGARIVLNHTNALQNSTINTGPAGPQAFYFLAAGGGTYNLGGLKGEDDLGITTNSINVGANGQSTTFSGRITGSGSVIKSGSGTLTLTGTNTYTSGTIINNGTLAINGSIDGGAVTVATNGTVGGYGQINGAVTVQQGGKLSLGASVGALTISNALTFQPGSTCVMKLAKGSSPSNDVVQGVSSLTMDGTLAVTVDPGMAALVAGDSFQLFQAAGYSGTFAATSLPVLPAGLKWDTSGLTNGLLSVVASAVTPPPPATLSRSTRSGNNLVLVWSGGTNASCTLWTATNVAQSRTTWTPVVTNAVGPDGLSTNTLPITPGEPKRFYLLTVPFN